MYVLDGRGEGAKVLGYGQVESDVAHRRARSRNPDVPATRPGDTRCS
jgi:hypothetical protein